MSNFKEWAKEEFCPMDLHTAASIGSLERVQQIIKNSECKGVNVGNKDGWTPLMYAACCGDPQIVHFLLNVGASPNQTYNKCPTPLIVATKCGDLESATILIDNGADVNAKDSSEWTALFYASSYGQRSILQMLLTKGSNVNQCDSKEGMTPLILAAAAGHKLIVKDLLLCGANLYVASKSGATALSAAVKNGHTKVKNVIDAHLFHKQGHIPSVIKNPVPQSYPENVRELLDTLGLVKYYPIFENHKIDMTKFFTLTDENLKDMGIGLIGPRKKIANAINIWEQNHQTVQNKCNVPSSAKVKR